MLIDIETGQVVNGKENDKGFKFFRFDREVWKNDIYLFPTVRIFVRNQIYGRDNFSVEVHWLVFHFRWLWIKED